MQCEVKVRMIRRIGVVEVECFKCGEKGHKCKEYSLWVRKKSGMCGKATKDAAKGGGSTCGQAMRNAARMEEEFSGRIEEESRGTLWMTGRHRSRRLVQSSTEDRPSAPRQ